MTNERVKVVGTFVLDGMIQGKIPPGPGFEKGVREWIARQRGKGLQFEFSTDGNNFSLLPDDSPGRTASFAPEGITPYLEKAYRELLDLIPATGRMGLLSTLRSIEYREGSEIQTVHLLENPGIIKSRQRTVEAETVTPPTEPGPGRKVKLALGGMVMAAVFLYLTSFFIDWKNHLFGPIGELMADPESIPIEADAFDGFFLVEGKEYDGGARMIRVEISPGPLLEIAPPRGLAGGVRRPDGGEPPDEGDGRRLRTPEVHRLPLLRQGRSTPDEGGDPLRSPLRRGSAH